MSTTVGKWLEQLDTLRYNPVAVQRLTLDVLENSSARTLDLVDPTNPFVFLSEAAATLATSCMIHNEALARQQYPSLALTEDELYLHMSDADYVGRFGSPGRAKFFVLMGKEELYAKAVPVGTSGVRKLTIPRNTVFSIAGVDFTMQYPIDIRIMGHGGLQVVYDTDTPSPLQTLSTNIVDWSIIRLGRDEFLQLQIPVHQFAIKSEFGKLNLTEGFVKTFTYQNDFYYARAYRSDAQGRWIEIRTTHTDQVYDPAVPTAVLKVKSGELQVQIPQIYATTGLLDSELRVDIYTTRGPLEMLLENYAMTDFTAKWVDLDGNASAAYYMPLQSFTALAVYSVDSVAGGTKAITFDQLRNRVMLNATGAPDLPITNVQLSTRLEDLGYDMVKDVDNITNRQFLATRALPPPTDGSVISGMGCSVQTLSTTMDDLLQYRNVRDNGTRMSLLPSMLYRTVNGILKPVGDVEVDSILAMPVDVRARRIAESTFLYCPFHSVLDTANNSFDLRNYYLDSPKITAKTFVHENDELGIEVGTGESVIERIPEGYRVTVVTRSSEVWKSLADSQAHCQLAFRPVGQRDYAYHNGELIGLTAKNERVYQFELGTNYDVDPNDNIVLTTFQMYNDPERKHAVPLDGTFEVFYAVSDIDSGNAVPSSIDQILGVNLLPANTWGVVQERLSIQLGRSLRGLWSASRSVASSQDYQRHLVDVPMFYKSNVYKRDPVSGAIEFTIDGNGQIQYTVLHALGDPVLDDQGQPVIQYYAGEPVLDPDGVPVVVSGRKLLRQIDLVLLDGTYWFANDVQAASYRNSIPEIITDWVGNDIGSISKNLLEQTDLFLYPKTTLGPIKARVEEGAEIVLPAQQKFDVTFYLSALQYRDSALRQSLTRMAIETIHESLQNAVVTVNGIISKLTAKAGTDIIGVTVTGFGPTGSLQAVSLLDDSARMSIQKRAEPMDDGRLTVLDDVNVVFLQHSL